MKKQLILFLFIFYYCLTVNAQTLINGDLDGTIFGLTSLPDYWENVPYGDVASMASNVNSATADLTDSTGPVAFLGIMGNPFSGYTFVSGEHAESTSGEIYHEGIQQLMDSLTPGVQYTIRFYQSVVKSSVALDQSGSWEVFFDSSLIAVTAPTFSTAPYNSISFAWQVREVHFVATGSEHMLKFLPLDDDADHVVSASLSGALRMGIDSISFFPSQGTFLAEAVNAVIEVYPVPVKDNIIINLNRLYEKVRIQLLNAAGSLMIERSESNIEHVKIATAVRNGFYFLLITADDKRFYKKIVVSN
jgi:hypothetical protein